MKYQGDYNILEKLLLYYTQADETSKIFNNKIYSYVISLNKKINGFIRYETNELFIFHKIFNLDQSMREEKEYYYELYHIKLYQNIINIYYNNY